MLLYLGVLEESLRMLLGLSWSVLLEVPTLSL